MGKVTVKLANGEFVEWQNVDNRMRELVLFQQLAELKRRKGVMETAFNIAGLPFSNQPVALTVDEFPDYVCYPEDRGW